MLDTLFFEFVLMFCTQVHEYNLSDVTLRAGKLFSLPVVDTHSEQWRNYYGLGPGEPGGPQPQWAKWGPPGSGCRAKTLARASDMSQCRFLTIRIL